MKRFLVLRYVTTGIAGLGLVLPAGAWAADAGHPLAQASTLETSSILDVSLGSEGTLTGQVVDAQGAPIPNTPVTVRMPGSAPVSAATDANGSFTIPGLQGGVYDVECAGGSGTFRLWTATASPPSANQGVLIVAGGAVTRGQFFKGNPGGSLIMVGLLGGIVAAGLITDGRSSS